jgi:amidase
VIDDKWNAFVPGEKFLIQEQANGSLAGLTMSVKDLFDIAGHPTGAGNPDWRSSHAVPLQHADLVQTLFNAGAGFVGKTITEELAYSLVGENAHYGTPMNPHNPDCIPGGSSSGAAAAAGAGLCAESDY